MYHRHHSCAVEWSRYYVEKLRRGATRTLKLCPGPILKLSGLLSANGLLLKIFYGFMDIKQWALTRSISSKPRTFMEVQDRKFSRHALFLLLLVEDLRFVALEN